MANSVSLDLFDKIQGRFSNIKLGNNEARRVLNPEDAVFFDFDYTYEGKNYGNVVINLMDPSIFAVYFNSNIISDANQEVQNDWYAFLEELSKFATRNLLNYEIKNIMKQRLDKKDYAELINKDKVSESIMSEQKKKSGRRREGDFFDFQKWSNAVKRIDAALIGDNKKAVAMKDGIEVGDWEQTDDEEQIFSRTLVKPENVGYGILYMDDKEVDMRSFEMPEELELFPGDNVSEKRRFSDKQSKYTFILMDIAERAVDDDVSLFAAEMATRISTIGSAFGQKMTQENEKDFSNAIKLINMYNRQEHYKNPIMAMESRLNRILEDTWTIPNDEIKINELKKAFEKPLNVGVDGQNAMSVLYDIIGDDALFDDISDKSSDSDARKIISEWIVENIDKYDIDFEIRDELMTLANNFQKTY